MIIFHLFIAPSSCQNYFRQIIENKKNNAIKLFEKHFFISFTHNVLKMVTYVHLYLYLHTGFIPNFNPLKLLNTSTRSNDNAVKQFLVGWYIMENSTQFIKNQSYIRSKLNIRLIVLHILISEPISISSTILQSLYFWQ